MNIYMTIVMWFILLIAMFALGWVWGQYRTRMRLLRLIGGVPNDLVGIRNIIVVRSVRLHILDKFEKGEQKWNW